ncbi:alpha-N-arabinofuranosidase [Halosimplex rubrum]|uniref:non-reducing end alpha-L-arabinofuranosidase n=1 Tax=Halosimplex rubrum TaxID=869889 RepID=A0A7D5T5D9_9EURY|nr:alpha-L-arabinofuranosidase C-terminal domain-containing protein [Halosimplex rubrum]QLH78450.1 alpha-N-arabinofuranosidase [Halosimplex rubrum]
MGREEIFIHRSGADSDRAAVAVDVETRLSSPVEPDLYAKFCEHLGRNIYHGMEAQILFNPTFGKWPFHAPGSDVAGGFKREYDLEAIESLVTDHDYHRNLPEVIDAEVTLDAYTDGVAFGWMYAGDAERVIASPDVGPTGNQAQRVETTDVAADRPAGLRQWTALPHHRTRGFECRVKARAKAATDLTLSLSVVGEDGTTGEALAAETVSLDEEWTTHEPTLELPAEADFDDDTVFEFALTTTEPANVVVERALLYPDDHVDYADPEVIEFLRERELPLLRWPGGNFVSGYHWRDGVGPVDERPTKPNPAWGGLEYNLFGTDEFMRFCENVGCEPMICVNAGDGTPEEAAKWVEYCNGDPDETEMGALRAENGHPEPYDVTYWEVGNELYGEWQVNWTTKDGYADRYQRFHDAMTAVDPDIRLQAIGDLRGEQFNDWNEHLLAEAGESVRALTQHILAGGAVDETTDPDELFHAFMGFSEQLGERFKRLEALLRDAGIDDPRIAITELQLFATFTGDDADGADEADPHAADGASALSPETMPTPQTISEALYDATIIHECIRTGGLVEMITHSATVNHGGGLQKERERVWADPCYYGHAMGAPLWGGTPVGVELECATISTEYTFREIDPVEDVPALDVMAVLSPDESSLTLMIVNCASRGEPVSLSVDTGAFNAAAEVDRVTLSAETMHAENTRDEPERVTPESSTVTLSDDDPTVTIEPYSLTRLTFERVEE